VPFNFFLNNYYKFAFTAFNNQQSGMGEETKNHKSIKVFKHIDLYLLIASAILIIPLIYTNSTLDPNMAPRLMALGVLILISSFLKILKLKRIKSDFNFLKLVIFPIFILYILWVATSLTNAINWAEGMYDLTKTTLSFLLLAFAVQVFNDNENSFTILTKTVVVSSLFASSLGLYQYFTHVPGKSGHELFMALYAVKGLMAHKNQFAISLMLMLPFSFYGMLKFNKWWKGLSIYSSVIILTNIVVVQSRSVWVATLVLIVSFGILWLVFFTKRNKEGILFRRDKTLTTAIVAIIIIGIGFGAFQKTEAFKTMKYRAASLFDTKSHDNQGRLMMWKSTWELANDNILTGVGAGNWRIAILPYYEAKHGSKYQNWRRPHNDFLWVFSEKGVIGVTLYLLLFLIVFYYGIYILIKEEDSEKKLITLLLTSGIIAYFVTAQFSFPLERINHQVYLMLMMATIVSIYHKKQNAVKHTRTVYIAGGLIIAMLLSGFSVYYSVLLAKSEFYVRKIYSAMNADDQSLIIINADKAFSVFTTVDYYAVPIYKYKGSANFKMKNFAQAQKDFEIALKQFPTNILVLSYLAMTSAEQHNNNQAISYLKKSIELYPHYEDGLHNLVNIYYLEKDYEKAYLTLLQSNTQNKFKDYDGNMKALKQLINRTVK